MSLKDDQSYCTRWGKSLHCNFSLQVDNLYKCSREYLHLSVSYVINYMYMFRNILDFLLVSLYNSDRN